MTTASQHTPGEQIAHLLSRTALGDRAAFREMLNVKPVVVYPVVPVEYASRPEPLRRNPTSTAVGAAGSAVSKVTGSLATGILSLLVVVPVTMVCMYFVYRRLPLAEATRVERAIAAGEPV